MSEANRAAALHRCLFGTADHHCAQPAAVHVLVTNDTATMSCRTHATWWNHHPHTDQHRIGHTCGIPATTWVLATPYRDGWCEVDGLTTTDDHPAPAALADTTP